MAKYIKIIFIVKVIHLSGLEIYFTIGNTLINMSMQ